MSLLSGLSLPEDVKHNEDSLGTGSKYGPWESGVYDCVIDTVYLDTSSGGAVSANFTFKTKEGKELNQTIYITSGSAKGRKTYYERDGDKIPLPGFTTANDIALLTVGENIVDLETETKVLSLYDYTARKEVPQQKEVIMDMLGKPILLGVMKVIEDKNVKNAQGVYVPSGETRTTNEIAVSFRASDRKSAGDIRNGKEAGFIDQWLEKNNGITKDKSKGATAGSTATAAAPSSDGVGETSATKKLFS